MSYGIYRNRQFECRESSAEATLNMIFCQPRSVSSPSSRASASSKPLPALFSFRGALRASLSFCSLIRSRTRRLPASQVLSPCFSNSTFIPSQ